MTATAAAAALALAGSGFLRTGDLVVLCAGGKLVVTDWGGGPSLGSLGGGGGGGGEGVYLPPTSAMATGADLGSESSLESKGSACSEER